MHEPFELLAMIEKPRASHIFGLMGELLNWFKSLVALPSELLHLGDQNVGLLVFTVDFALVLLKLDFESFVS